MQGNSMPEEEESKVQGDRVAQPPSSLPSAIPEGKAFISYASADKAAADSIVAALEGEGITCWIAPRDVTPGVFYADAIVQALNAAQLLIVVLSAHSVGSQHVLREVERASSKKRPLVAFRLDAAPLPPGLEYFLSASQWLDASAGAMLAALPHLIEAVRKMPALAAPSAAQLPPYETPPLPSIWRRFKQNKVAHWTLAYAAFAFAFLRAVALLIDALAWPHEVQRITMVVVLIGLPIVSILAWYHGVRALKRLNGSELLLIGLLLAMGGSLLWFVPRPTAERTGTETASLPKTPNAKPASGTEVFSPPARSVAVLPLVNLSGDNKDAYLGDGISGEILSALSQLSGLEVIGHASSFQFRDRDVDAAKVGKALNVRSLLTGTVQRAGDNLRISVELIDTRSGVQLWSQHFDRSFENLFVLEDDIANAVSATLAVKLGMAAGRPLVYVDTENPHAHDLYLRAREVLYRTDEASVNQAIALFSEAIAEDPNYATAWAGLAYAYIALADAYRSPIDLLPAMKAAAEKAVTLDSKLAEGHAYLSYILMSYERDFAAGERESEKAVALSPGSADVQFFLGMDRVYTRQAASSRSAFQVAEKLDPLNPLIPFFQILAATALGDSATAVQQAQRTLEIDPDFFYSTDPLVLAYGSFSRWQDCVARFAAAQAGTRLGREPDYKAAVCYAHVGNNAYARRMLAQLETAARKRYVDQANIAEIHVALGEKDAALKALDQAYHDRSQPLALVWSNPEFGPLHDDARYQALMARVHPGMKPNAAP
ncbi:MAG TPA: TIR domain-containing protein [Candidatus Binataceae bacterium]|nr:TIR domain-containing protein [Candidatus Binataceae bacterium]